MTRTTVLPSVHDGSGAAHVARPVAVDGAEVRAQLVAGGAITPQRFEGEHLAALYRRRRPKGGT